LENFESKNHLTTQGVLIYTSNLILGQQRLQTNKKITIHGAGGDI
jgi:hypothetical protein